MSNTVLGTIAELWRYPVKSMQGERVLQSPVDQRGLAGDRCYAIIDRATGQVASAKHPRKWGALLACRAAFATEPQPNQPLPPIWISLPDGTTVSSQDQQIDAALSRALGREVYLTSEVQTARTREADRTELEEGAPETVREEPLALAAPEGTLFDVAPLHLLTTSTLGHLGQLYPAGQFDVRRFRPNVVLALPEDAPSFAEQRWLGMWLAAGSALLEVIDPCPRCVVTTAAQRGLPRDAGILRTLANSSSSTSLTLAPGVLFSAVAGVYAQVTQPGSLIVGGQLLQADSTT